MKKFLVVLVVVVMVMALAVPVFAAPGGMPAAHGEDGLDGWEFGAVVSETAQAAPCVLVDHVSGFRGFNK